MPDPAKRDDREANPHHLPWEWEHRPSRGCVVFDCRGKEVCSTYKEKRADYIVSSANARQNTVGVEEVRELVEAASRLDDAVTTYKSKTYGTTTEPTHHVHAIDIRALAKVQDLAEALQAKLTHPQPAQTPAPEDHDG